jgi:hypothetical protein
MRLKKNDYRFWLYDYKFEHTTPFFEHLQGIVASNNIRLNLLVLASAKELSTVLSQWTPESYSIRLKHSEPVFSITVTKEFDGKREVTTRATVIKYHPDAPIYLVISDCQAGEFKTVITQFLSKYFPEISRVFLTNDEMENLFKAVEDATGFRVIVDSSVCKKRLPGLGKKESQITYTDLPYMDVFEKALENDQWVNSIRYTAYMIVKPPRMDEIRTRKFTGIVSRSCFFSIRSDLTPLLNTVIPLTIKFASARNQYFAIRSQSASEIKPEPVVIKFEEPIFENIARNKQFVDSLTQLEDTSVSEYHTNPYLHVSLLDYLDGSSYDIWIVSSNRLVIIPQFSASAASMSRLINHVFERVQEGKIEEYGTIKIA